MDADEHVVAYLSPIADGDKVWVLGDGPANAYNKGADTARSGFVDNVQPLVEGKGILPLLRGQLTPVHIDFTREMHPEVLDFGLGGLRYGFLLPTLFETTHNGLREREGVFFLVDLLPSFAGTHCSFYLLLDLGQPTVYVSQGGIYIPIHLEPFLKRPSSRFIRLAHIGELDSVLYHIFY